MNLVATSHPRIARTHPGWHVLGAVLVCGWLAVMWLMFGGRPDDGAIELTVADLPGSLIEDDAWMGAYFEATKLGYVHVRIDEVAEGIRLQHASRLQIALEGRSQVLETRLETLLQDGFKLTSFSFELNSPFLQASMDGRAQGEQLHVRISMGDRVQHLSWPLQEPPLFSPAVAQVIARQDLEPGLRYRVQEFDPRSMSNQPVVYEVVGREAISWAGRMVPAIHLRRRVGGQQLDMWMDQVGRVLREKLDLGLLLEREEREQATLREAREMPVDEDTQQLFERLLPRDGQGEP